MTLFKKLLIFVIFSATFLYASPTEVFQSLGYEANYKETLAKAEKNNKPIMLVLVEKTCPWCRKLEKETLKSKEINKFVQENFIAVGLEKNDDVYPKYLKPEVAPTVIFVNPKDGSVIYIAYGYLVKEEFLIILTEINRMYLKYMK